MTLLTREVRCSVDRDWAGHIDFTRPVTNSWGGWPSAVGLVPYLKLRATLSGTPDPLTGYVCNITLLDRLLREHAIPHAADELHRRGWRLSAERLLQAIWERAAQRTPAGTRLAQLELATTPCLRYAIRHEEPHMVRLTQQFEFSAAHRLHCPQLSDEENRRIFGKCNNPNGHGHNYIVEVTVSAVPDEQTGAVMPLPHFEQVVREHVVEVFDHKHLNLDTEHFAHANPSVENIARAIWHMLAERVAPARLDNVRVFETPKTWADYSDIG